MYYYSLRPSVGLEVGCDNFLGLPFLRLVQLYVMPVSMFLPCAAFEDTRAQEMWRCMQANLKGGSCGPKNLSATEMCLYGSAQRSLPQVLRFPPSLPFPSFLHNHLYTYYQNTTCCLIYHYALHEWGDILSLAHSPQLLAEY